MFDSALSVSKMAVASSQKQEKVDKRAATDSRGSNEALHHFTTTWGELRLTATLTYFVKVLLRNVICCEPSNFGTR